MPIYFRETKRFKVSSSIGIVKAVEL